MKYLLTFLISMVPVIELRGAIPYGISAGLEPWLVYPLAALGNLLPVPFILLFIRKIFQWMKRYEKLGKIATKLEERAASKSGKVKKSEFIGLLLFVAIPLPGTGAWTGALIAALMDMRLKRAISTIALGVVLAGLLVTLVMVLGIHALDFFLG
ncbi:MAG: small multi-drug export protein [Oscillospiraceae bacterium]|nr:small multi-drug export protein [Oscillospiraceae bacterium]